MNWLETMVQNVETALAEGFKIRGTREGALEYAREQTTAGDGAWATAVSRWDAANSARVESISKIARRQLGVLVLESRGRDSLDFHTLGVDQIKEALLAAYDAGRQSQTGGIE